MTGLRKRSNKPRVDQSKLGGEMTDWTRRQHAIAVADANYNALVGGTKGKQKSDAAASRRYDYHQERFRRAAKRKSR